MFLILNAVYKSSNLHTPRQFCISKFANRFISPSARKEVEAAKQLSAKQWTGKVHNTPENRPAYQIYSPAL